jgi:hypothetical protein
MMELPWGKYRGDDVEDVPTSYLVWLLENAENLRPALREAICAEVAERLDLDVAARVVIVLEMVPAPLLKTAEELIEAGKRVLALRRHPDVGGTHEGMLELQNAVAALRRYIGG